MLSITLLGLLSTQALGGGLFREDPVYIKAAWIVGGVLSLVGGAGIGTLAVSTFFPPQAMPCCKQLAACESQNWPAQTSFVAIDDQSICKLPTDCTKWLANYKAGCNAERDDRNRDYIIGAVVGAGVGALGFGIFAVSKIFFCKPAPEPERGPLIV